MRKILPLVLLACCLAGCGQEGSEAGAGGAGPGYDGSSQGTGKEGTVPAPGTGVGSGLNNSNLNPAATNR